MADKGTAAISCWLYLRQWLFILMAVGLGSARACEFPDFMQTNSSTQRDWRSRVRGQYTEFGLRITVTKSQMEVRSTDSTSSSYTRLCMKDISPDKFLVAHEEAGQSGLRYTCMQFVVRSQNVVQVRQAPVSTSRMDETMCDDGTLELDNWVIIDYNHIMQDRVMCPLRGGYTIRMYDKRQGEGVCDSYNGHTRLEGECVEGEGLFFHFRDTRCIPDSLYMYHEQRTHCMAYWVEGHNTYVMIRHDQLEYMWMFRYPSTPGSSFNAFLINDLVAPPYNQIDDTRNYVRLDCVRDHAMSVTSLCVDNYELCTYSSDPCQRGELAMTCPRRCGVCNASRPLLCDFPSHLHGDWHDITRTGTATSVHINSTSLTTLHGEKRENFHCIQWDVPSQSRGHEKFASDRLLVTDYDNGCTPRYSCAHFLQKGTSTLFFRISQTRTWPFTDAPSTPITCEPFQYEQDAVMAPNPFRTKHSRLLYASSLHGQVPCGLPDDLHNPFEVTLQHGGTCRGSLLQSDDETTLHLGLEETCQGGENIENTHICLESARILPTSDLLIITRTARRSQHVHCWIFPKRPRTTFYMVEGTHCNEVTKRRIRKGKLVPTLVFNKFRRKDPLVQLSTPAADIDEDPHVTYGDFKDDSDLTPPRVNDSRTTTDDSKVSSTPFVVIAAVLFFVIFQIPCACRSS